jgi:hypothetical protein
VKIVNEEKTGGISNIYGTYPEVILLTNIQVVNPVSHTYTSKGDEPPRPVIVISVGIYYSSFR